MKTSTIPEVNRVILRLPQVEMATDFKKSKLYQLINAGEFPAPVIMGPKYVGWYSDLVQEWIDNLS